MSPLPQSARWSEVGLPLLPPAKLPPMTRAQRRSTRNEAGYLPRSIADQMILRSALLGAGVSERVADGIVTWVTHKATGQPDRLAATTRARYRRALADLAGQPHNAPGSGRPVAVLTRKHRR